MPPTRRSATAFLLALFACSDSTDDGGPVPAELRLLSSSTSTGTPGWPLADSVVVEVRDAQGNPMEGVRVNWTGPGIISPAASTTNGDGRVAASWTLGLTERQQNISVTAGNLPAVTVSATGAAFHAEDVTVGGVFACAISAGRAYCWGDNRFGQLGIGTTSNELAVVPQPVSGDLTFSDISAGGAVACGLVNGAAYCWGSNESGETGTGVAGAPILRPTPVATALRFTGITAEGRQSWDNSVCGITPQGEVWCWGDNVWGKLGDGTQVNSPFPVRVQSDVVFSRVETGYFHACALSETAALWCWGEQETDGGGLGPRPKGFYTTPVSVADGYTFNDVSLGRDWTCGLTLENRAYCWGSNNSGELGVTLERSAAPVAVSGGLSFLSLSAGNMEENIGLTSDLRLYRWGSIGNDARQFEPVPVTESLSFLSADPGEFPFERAAGGSCGIVSGGAVYCVDDQGRTPRGVPRP
jgi:alpha-tubulin suppressor-like RCC1 family protein